MRCKRTLQHCVLAVYGTALLSGFGFTMFRSGLPFVPEKLTMFAYGTMAPFQGYNPYVGEWNVSGRSADGTWHTIDTLPYEPYLRGERIFRELHLLYRVEHKDERLRFLASRLAQLEAEQGKKYEQIRFEWWQWPASPAGFDALKQGAFIRKELIAELTP